MEEYWSCHGLYHGTILSRQSASPTRKERPVLFEEALPWITDTSDKNVLVKAVTHTIHIF